MYSKAQMKNTTLYSTFFFLVLITSCSTHRFVKDVEQLMQQQVTFPSDWRAIYKGKDTVLTDFWDTPVKLIVWYDSLFCTPCQAIAMYKWYNIVDYADSLAPSFRIVYLFSPRKDDIGIVYRTLKADKFEYPIFIDHQSSFAKQNQGIPKNQDLHSFLLDKNNNVVMVGNPLHNPRLWELYKMVIQKMITNNGTLSEN